MEIEKNKFVIFIQKFQNMSLGDKFVIFWSETQKTWGLWVTETGPLGEE